MTDLDPQSDNEIDIARHCGELVCAINGAINALTRASTALADLISNQVYDTEFAEGATGIDLTAFLDDSLRFTRASHRLAQEVIDAH